MDDVTDTGILTRGEAVKELHESYGLEDWRARRILEIAQEFTRKAEPLSGGFVHVVYRGCSRNYPFTERFQIYNHARPSPGKVALGKPRVYTSIKPQHQLIHTKETAMPARTRRAAPAPEPEPEELEPEFDPAPYLEKGLTATMQDYVQWWKDVVGDPDQMESDLLITLGARFYTYFQKSQFNIDNREARRAERASAASARAAANGEADEEEPEEAAPPRRTRAAAKPAAGRPARKPAAAPEPEPEAPAKPARRGRKPAAAAAY